MWIVKSCGFYLHGEMQQCKGKTRNIFRNVIQGNIRIFQQPKTSRFIERGAPMRYSLELSFGIRKSIFISRNTAVHVSYGSSIKQPLFS